MEFVGHQLFDPFLVCLGSGSVPAIQAIELEYTVRNLR